MPPDTRRAAALACLLVIGAVVAAVPVGAQESGGTFTPFADDDEDEDDGLLPDLPDFVGTDNLGTAVERLLYGVQATIGTQEAATASGTAEEVTTYFNDNSAAFVSYAAQNIDSSETNKTNFDVIKLRFESEGEQATRYLVAEVNSDDVYNGAEVVQDTDRTVDYTVTFEDYALERLPEDLRYIKTEYVDEDRAPDEALKQRLASAYAGNYEVTEGSA